jgi:hypothetical protein
MVTNIEFKKADDWIIACWVVVKIRRYYWISKDQNNIIETDLVENAQLTAYVLLLEKSAAILVIPW